MGFLLVFIGSGLGGMARYGVGVLSARWFGVDFPISTLAVNILGSAILGLIVVLFTKLNVANQDARLFLATGVIGGFTTFSTFSLDAVALWESGDHFGAAGYVGASVVLSLVAIVVAMWLVRRFV